MPAKGPGRAWPSRTELRLTELGCCIRNGVATSGGRYWIAVRRGRSGRKREEHHRVRLALSRRGLAHIVTSPEVANLQRRASRRASEGTSPNSMLYAIEQ